MSRVFPAPPPPGVSGPASVISAWGGGDDHQRGRLMVWGGGHADYAGNEIYAFDLHQRSWSVLWGPTPTAQIPTESLSYEQYLDGNPSSRHTYDSLVYLPDPIDGLWAQGGSLWKAGSSGGPVTWLFDLSRLTWRQLADHPHTVGGYPRMTSIPPPATSCIATRGTPVATIRAPTSGPCCGGTGPNPGPIAKPAPWIRRSRFFMLGGGALHIVDLKTKTYHAEVPPPGTTRSAMLAPPVSRIGQPPRNSSPGAANPTRACCPRTSIYSTQPV